MSGTDADAMSGTATGVAGVTRGGSTPESGVVDCKVTILRRPQSDRRAPIPFLSLNRGKAENNSSR